MRWRVREAPAPARRPREDAVARLWSRAHMLPSGLRTERGRRFRVVYPGRPGGPSGPDFVDSVIETADGERIRGDVEIHVEAPDWYRHGHHDDPAYNGVILHVVMRTAGRKASAQQSGASTPIVEMPDEPASDAGELVLASLQSATDDEIEERLDRAGDMRFLAKARGYALELGASAPDEVIYAALMEGLGYSANRRAFRLLAGAVPYSSLAALRGEPGSARRLAVEALLLYAAHLLDRAASEERQAMDAILARLSRPRRVPKKEWTTSGARPANHPARRIAGAARILDGLLDVGPAEAVAAAVRGGSAPRLAAMLSARPFVGTGRARELAVNAALPFAHALGGVMRDESLKAASREMYERMPALQENAVTREMRRILEAAGKRVTAKSARRRQGLIQLYRSMTRPTTDVSPLV